MEFFRHGRLSSIPGINVAEEKSPEPWRNWRDSVLGSGLRFLAVSLSMYRRLVVVVLAWRRFHKLVNAVAIILPADLFFLRGASNHGPACM